MSGELGAPVRWLMRYGHRVPGLVREVHSEWRSGTLGGWWGRKRREWLVWNLLATRARREEEAYARWVATHDALTVEDERAIGGLVAGLPRRPKISVLVPVHETPERWLRRAIESVRGQLYPDWELCLADDASKSPGVRAILEEHAASDTRIKVVFRRENGHIAAATNSALELATGEFVALLDHDDELRPHALAVAALALARDAEIDLLYTDEDKIDEAGRRFAPFFKGGFNPALMLSRNSIGHLGVYRTALVRELGGFRTGFDGSQDYDLGLRLAPRARRVHHVPHVLYHFRAAAGSTALDGDAKPYILAAGQRALDQHLARTTPGARAERIGAGLFRVHFPLPEPRPLVSFLGSAAATSYPRTETVARLEDAKGELVLSLRGVEPASPDWLEELVAQVSREKVALVGGKILDPDACIAHAGFAVAPGVALDRAGGLPQESDGEAGEAVCVQDVAAVSAEALLARRDVLLAHGGLGDVSPEAMVALGGRLRAAGQRVVFTPHAVFAGSRRAARFAIAGGGEDPFYDPNRTLDPEREPLVASRPPRAPWRDP